MANYIIRRNRSKRKINYSFPVVIISRSNKNVIAQVLEADTKKTLFTVDSSKSNAGTKVEKSKLVGQAVAAKLKEMNIDKAVFDRNGFIYHGRVKAIAESIRESGISI